MNSRIIFPNNPLFFLQFIFLPAVIIALAQRAHVTLENAVMFLGATKLTLIIFCYFLMVVGIVLNSLVTIDDNSIRGPSGGLSLLPPTILFVGAECSIEKKRTRRLTYDCLIIRNKNKSICLPSLYFTHDFFDEIINTIRIANEQKRV